MLKPAEVVKDETFSRTRIWFDQDCISFLADEPQGLREERFRAEEAVISARPEVDEEMSEDARFLVPLGSIETFEVRPLTEAKGTSQRAPRYPAQGDMLTLLQSCLPPPEHYLFSLDLNHTIAVDGRPFPDQALPAGPATQRRQPTEHEHQLNFVVVCGDSDVQLLRSVIENRRKVRLYSRHRTLVKVS